MGKRKAAKLATLRAGDSTGLRREIEQLTTISENLQVLLKRETEKATSLQSQIEVLTVDLASAKEKNANLEAQLAAITKKAETKTVAPKEAKATKVAKTTKKTTAKARAAGA
tara:strand:+ start:54 stop:389 length:336 start_codon:yes stop_codon:yes gene_type:complete